MERLRGYIAAAIGAFSVWWAAPLVKLAGVDPLVAAWWRFTIGALGALAAHRLLCSGCPSPLDWRGAWAAGTLLAAHMILWFAALQGASVLVATAVVCTYPAFAALFDALRREIPAWKAAGVILALTSAALLSLEGAENAVPIALSLASSLAASGYFLVLRAERVKGVAATGLALHSYSTAAVLTTLASIAMGVNPLLVPQRSIPYLVALGLLPMLVGHTLLNYALAYLPASIVTSLVITEPPGATLLAFLLLGEEPSAREALYSTLALLATITALLPKNANYR